MLGGVKLDKITFYKKMLTIRRFEEKVSKLFSNGKIPGFIHLCIGQEATAVGVCENLNEEDYITSTHRGHGHCIAKGADIKKVMAELFGKKTGYCKGKGGSMHVADVSAGILGANGIVAGGLPIAIGAGVSLKNKNKQNVVVSFFGEGSTGSGTFHEALNMAAVLKLPIIFFCENNQYAEFTSIEKHLPIKHVYEKASSYGIKGLQVDGNNVLEVYTTLEKCIKDIRQTKVPILVEALTYRWKGHYEGDPEKYRDIEEVNYWREQKDPINILRNQLDSAELSKIEQIHHEVEQEIKEAVNYAEKSPYPHEEETLEDVYA